MPSQPISMGKTSPKRSTPSEVHVVWLTAGLSCDGDSVSVTAAEQPSIEDLILGAIPGLPKVALHNPVLAYENGDDFMKFFYEAEAGRLDPFVLVVEGSIPNEKIKAGRLLGGAGNRPDKRPADNDHRMDRPSGSQGAGCRCCRNLRNLRGHSRHGRQPHRSHGLGRLSWLELPLAGGFPIVNVPGCPVQPDNMMETLLYLVYMAAGMAPVIPLDDQLRPTWLFGKTVHEGCDRAGYYEQGDFALEYGSPKCIVKLGCWGPVVNCNVTKRGWMRGIGGCPNVGGICIACTMPGFPDKAMPFMDEPPGARLSTVLSGSYGKMIRALREVTNNALNKEPKWRHRKGQLTTGYQPRTYLAPVQNRRPV